MTPAARFAALIELTDLLLAEWQRDSPRPAELVLKAYMRERRYIGGGDRRALQESLFALLRGLGAAKAKCASGGLPENGRSLAICFAGAEATALCEGGKYGAPPLSDAELHMIHAPLTTRHSLLPEWLDALLREQYGEEADALNAALQEPAPVDLRVNLIKTTREAARAALAKEGVETTPIEGLPEGLEAPRHANITQTQTYLNGWAEVQDRGSQGVIQNLLLALQTEQGEAQSVGFGENTHSKEELESAARGSMPPLIKIIDYCAGGGGKSLALASALNNHAEIIAWDWDAKRLSQLTPRAARAGAACIVKWELASDTLPLADIVLVDAPCSGTGTIRRHPDLPWRLTPKKIAEYQQLQSIVLQKAAQKVKKGGYLCYVTCSLLESENIQCVNDFLTNNINFRVAPLAQMWNKETAKIALSLQFLPHSHQSDGFYLALLKHEI
jgi:16S rRNA (cytosine967-C5)-methyltransferase